MQQVNKSSDRYKMIGARSMKMFEERLNDLEQKGYVIHTVRYGDGFYWAVMERDRRTVRLGVPVNGS